MNCFGLEGCIRKERVTKKVQKFDEEGRKVRSRPKYR